MTQIIPGISMVDGVRGAYSYVIVDDGITVIDAGMGGSEKAILNEVKSLGFGPADIKRIVITHSHIDHVGGVNKLREASKAVVMAGDADADVIEGKKPPTLPRMPFPRNLIFPILAPLFKAAPTPVDVRLHDGDTIPVLGGTMVIGLPGHSPGSIGLYSPSKKILFSGDALRMKGDDFIVPLNYDGEKAQCLASIKKMGSLDYGIMLSGHAKPIMAGASERVAAYAKKLGAE